MFFKKIDKDYSNIFYITNQFNWDKKGKAVSTKKPIIHCMNKDETILENINEIYFNIKDRKNVILLGDSISDLNMVNGFKYQNLLKIGFLNFDYENLKEEYKQNFDIIFEGDGDFSQINRLVKNLE